MIKGDLGAKAKKIEIKDKSNAIYTTYIGEGQIGKINFATGAFILNRFHNSDFNSECTNEPCSAPTTITLTEASQGKLVTLGTGFTEVRFLRVTSKLILNTCEIFLSRIHNQLIRIKMNMFACLQENVSHIYIVN